MTRTWSFYRLQDGSFSGRTFSARSASALDVNIPDGHGAIEGLHDHLSKRVEVTPDRWGDGIDGLSQRQVIDWQPPAPSGDHEWNAGTRRWQLSASATQKQRNSQIAIARIKDLEAAQARRVRELLAKDDERLRAIDEEIRQLRADL